MTSCHAPGDTSSCPDDTADFMERSRRNDILNEEDGTINEKIL
jgi:hypothetical protein